MEHPSCVVYLEHDGKVLLVDNKGKGPQVPTPNHIGPVSIRLPSVEEAKDLGLKWTPKNQFHILGIEVIKAHPEVEWPEQWAWKDDCISDNAVHPIAREAIYRSIHRLVSKIMIINKEEKVLMGKVERGAFVGHWTLPGGYMDHDEHPSKGCVREALEEMGIAVETSDDAPVISQRIFSKEGISFVSFTYIANWLGSDDDIKPKEGEIADYAWFSFEEALNVAVSSFDRAALMIL